MLLTFENGTRGGMCNAVHRYAKVNNKYMKNYNKNVESSFIEYLDANNLYGWAMSKKLPVGEFEWINPKDYREDIIKKYDENDDYGAILEAVVDYPKHLHKLHSDLPFLPERTKINKVHKLICNIKIVTTKKQRKKFASELNYHTTKYISEDLLIMEMKKAEVKMNKPIYLGQAILDISKTLMYEFWYDYLKPKYGDNVKLCYMGTDSFEDLKLKIFIKILQMM